MAPTRSGRPSRRRVREEFGYTGSRARSAPPKETFVSHPRYSRSVLCAALLVLLGTGAIGCKSQPKGESTAQGTPAPAPTPTPTPAPAPAPAPVAQGPVFDSALYRAAENGARNSVEYRLRQGAAAHARH